MNVAALERALARDPSAILVEARVLRRVIKRHRHLPGVGLDVPHGASYAIGRDDLLELVDARDLGPHAAELPEKVVLLPRPDPDERATDDELLRELWRANFHGHIHVAFEKRVADGALTDAAIRERIHRLGHCEFDEIRIALKQDDRLVARGEQDAWVEFAATYLELRHFAPTLLDRRFPVLSDLPRVDALLAGDVDVAAVLLASQPVGATAVSVSAPPSSKGERGRARIADPSRRPALVARAATARERGNRVRAALSLLAAGDSEGAKADLTELAQSLDTALGGAHDVAGGSAAWALVFGELAARAVHGSSIEWTVEARALFEVQKACLESAHMPRTVELMPFLRSFGRKAVVRDLPATREVHIARRLRAAAEHANRARVHASHRASVAEVFHALENRASNNARAALRPKLESTLALAGLLPRGAVERAALHTIVEQLLDAVGQRGFLGIGPLRDAVSRNGLKLSNVTAGELVRGDPLLVADGALSDVLDGVYRRGEIYLRSLQKFSSLAFGTRTGRVITLFVALPAGGAYVILAGISHLVTLIAHIFGGHHVHLRWIAPPPPITLRFGISFVALAAFLFGLLHITSFRAGVLSALRVLGGLLVALFVTLPRWIATRALVLRVFRSRAFHLLDRFVLRPGLITGLAWLVTPLRQASQQKAALPLLGVFVVANVALNSSVGLLAEELVIDFLARRVRWLRRHFLPGLFRLVAAFFHRLLELLERGIYAVDEWLRFRRGEHPIALVLKVAFGFLWFFVAYALRLTMNVFIEPQVNPIKHFPVVTVAHKIMLTFDQEMIGAIFAALSPLFGRVAAGAIGSLTVFMFPGIFGFLVWEFKENFRLYGQNRKDKLVPVNIGHHGETMVALLRPGIHSGTIPKLYAKLRRAIQRESTAATAHVEALHEVAEAIHRFVERELLAVLAASRTFRAGSMTVAKVELAASRVRIVLALEASTRRLVIHFEEQSGYLCAGIADPGFADDLDDEGRIALENAIAGLYRLAGADLSREVVDECVGGAAYDVSDEGLVVWPGEGYKTEIVYDLQRGPTLTPHVRGEPPLATPVAPDTRSLLLRDQPISHDDWVAAWERDRPERLSQGPSLLPPRR